MHITAKTARISTNDITASRIFLSLRARFAFSSASCFAALSRRLSASVCSKDAPPFTPRAFRALPALRPRALCPAPSTACPGVPTLAWGLSYVFFSAARAAVFSLFRFLILLLGAGHVFSYTYTLYIYKYRIFLIGSTYFKMYFCP